MASAADNMTHLNLGDSEDWSTIAGDWYVFRQHNVCAGAATGSADVEVRGVRVDQEDHVTSTEGDVVGWVGGHVIEELIDGVFGGLCCGGLLLAEFTEGNRECVVHSGRA